MDAKINYTLQDSNSLDATVTKHKDEMTAKGFEEASHQSLKDLRQDLVLKEAAQEKAEEKLTETTAAHAPQSHRPLRRRQPRPSAPQAGQVKPSPNRSQSR